LKPIFDVPHCWPINKQIIIITVIGTIQEWRLGAFNANPSTADKTLTAGVNAPSPKINQDLIRILLINKFFPINNDAAKIDTILTIDL